MKANYLLVLSALSLSACSGGSSSSGGGMELEVFNGECFASADEWRRQHAEVHAKLGGCISNNHPMCTRAMRLDGWNNHDATNWHNRWGRPIEFAATGCPAYGDAKSGPSREGFSHGG